MVTTQFRMETVHIVMVAVGRHDWMTSIDLRDAYLHVPVHSASCKFLCFVWEGRHFQFRTLCFGLSTVPQVFTRMMGLVSAASHRQGIRLLHYLDDWVLLHCSEQETINATNRLLLPCGSLGIQVNWESSLSPSQALTFLGMVIHTPHLKVFLTDQRVVNLRHHIKSFLSVLAPPAAVWLVLLGHMSSLIHLVPQSRRRMRCLQLCLSQLLDHQSDWNDLSVPWDNEILQALWWWSADRNLCVGQSLQMTSPDVALHTDALIMGWGASILHDSVSDLWAPHERCLHINLLELRAIRLSLLHFLEYVQGQTVAVFSNYATALTYLAKEGELAPGYSMQKHRPFCFGGNATMFSSYPGS